jgi:hypothetical protein
VVYFRGRTSNYTADFFRNLTFFCFCFLSRGRVVGIATGYGLDNRGVELESR